MHVCQIVLHLFLVVEEHAEMIEERLLGLLLRGSF
jgi:hypothetical protein